MNFFLINSKWFLKFVTVLLLDSTVSLCYVLPHLYILDLSKIPVYSCLSNGNSHEYNVHFIRNCYYFQPLRFCLPPFSFCLPPYTISPTQGLNSTGDDLIKILVSKIFSVSSKLTGKSHIVGNLYCIYTSFIKKIKKEMKSEKFFYWSN